MKGICSYKVMISRTRCLAVFTFTCFSMALVALISNKSKDQISFSSSVSSSLSSQKPPPNLPLPPPNSLMSLYPTFNSPKMQKAVENLARLNEEFILERGEIKDENMRRVESDLIEARWQIKDALIKSRTSDASLVQDADYVPRGEIYRNPHVFQRSYKLMERMFKIFVYEEGEPPLFHTGPSKNIYSSEGLFLNFIEANTNFRTRNPNEAHVYFLPFSVVMILEHLFDPHVRDKAVLGSVVSDYVGVISSKYSFWNRSLGADHFMLSCHDWGPRATWYVHQLYFTSMRVLCNANTSEFFNPRKDVSIPEINLPTGDLTGLTSTSAGSQNRTILAFFAGQIHHGTIRPVLFRQWQEKDTDILLFERLPENSTLTYKEMMDRSKFCLCPSGHEVASPRIVEAIYAECVPVLISKDYILPFSDVLDWDKFSVRVSVDEIPKLKEILMGVGEDRYRLLQAGVRQVQRHFVVNDPPKRYDVFHMMIHSLWLRRLNLRINT